ncbi:MAG: LamG-like jellyroll fold domain-containing protein [Mycobacteriaceae bacterium]
MRSTVGILASAVLLLAPAATVHAAPTLRAQWGMDELTGTTMTDSSGYGNNGTLSNVALGLPGASGAPDDFAYGFNGSSSHVRVANPVSLAPGSADITITMTVKTSVMPGTGNADFDMVVKGGYKVEIYPNAGIAQLRCKFNGSGGRVVLRSSNVNLADGSWHVIQCSKTAGQVSLSIDGAVKSQNITIGTIKAGKDLFIGQGTDANDHYNGVLDDVNIVVG